MVTVTIIPNVSTTQFKNNQSLKEVMLLLVTHIPIQTSEIPKSLPELLDFSKLLPVLIPLVNNL